MFYVTNMEISIWHDDSAEHSLTTIRLLSLDTTVNNTEKNRHPEKELDAIIICLEISQTVDNILNNYQKMTELCSVLVINWVIK